MADFRYIGGKREFFETKAIAERAREDRLKEFREYGTAAVALSGAEREEFMRAKARLKQFGATLAGAVDFYERHHRAFEPMPLEQGIQEVFQSKADTNKRDRSVSQFFYTLNAFQRHVGEGKLVSEISRADVESWVFNGHWAPATIRTKLIDLQTFFRAARVRGWTAQVPTDGIERIELENSAPGILTVEQCRELTRHCQAVRPKFCGWIALALFCGIRPDEIAFMRPEHVKVERGFVEVPAEVAKTRERRIVELSDNAKEWLRVGLVLPPQNPRGNLNAVRRASGFSFAKRELKDGKETWLRVAGQEWPHDALRHSFASYHLAFHGSADRTATAMGHRSTDMLFRHYRELVAPEEARAFWQIVPARTHDPKSRSDAFA